MCDLLPLVGRCFLVWSLRIGMLFIAVISVVTGSVALSVVESLSNVDLDSVKPIAKMANTTAVTGSTVMSSLNLFTNTGVTIMALVFIITGFFLLSGNLMDDLFLIEVSIVMNILNVFLFFLILILITYECVVAESCLLSYLHWLTSSAVMVFLYAYAFVWWHFVAVCYCYAMDVK